MDIEQQTGRVTSALNARDPEALQVALDEGSQDGELFSILSELPVARLRLLALLLGDGGMARILSQLDPVESAQLLFRLATEDAADILELMPPDDAADVIAEVEPEAAADILIEMEPSEADELRDLLIYPPDTAGGRMTPAFVAVDPDLRADQTVIALRQVAAQAETIDYVYVTDDDDRLLGVLILRDLVLNPPETPIRDLMVEDVISVPVTADQEIAAHLLVDNRLLSLPVVDDRGRLLGIITADDVADIIEQETTEDIERLGGAEPLAEPYLHASPVRIWRKRVIWLLVLFFGAAYTTTVLSYFEAEIEAAVALSFFIPLLIGTGGNVGSQVVTMLVRAMAVENVRLRDAARVIRKESLVGLMLGAVMALMMFARALLSDAGSDIAIVVALAVLIIVVWATLVGSILPLLLRRFGADPAVVSAPLITTLVDGTGLIIYFLIARAVLDL